MLPVLLRAVRWIVPLSTILFFSTQQDMWLFISFSILSISIFYASRSYFSWRYISLQSFGRNLQLLGSLIIGLILLSLFTLFGFLTVHSPLVFAIGLILLNVALWSADIYIIILLAGSKTTTPRTLSLIKKLHPYHPVFQKLWKSDIPFSLKLHLLHLEKDVLRYSERIEKILSVLISLKVISALSLIRPESRSKYKYLLDEKKHILSIEDVEENANSIVLTIETIGDFTGEELLSSKVKAKLYEAFSKTSHMLRAMNFQMKQSQLFFQFFSSVENEEKDIIKLSQSIELAFTDAEIKNATNQYPELSGYDIMDQEIKEGTKIIYSVKMRYHLPPGLSIDIFTAQKIAAIASYIRLPIYQHKIKPHEEFVDFFIELTPRDVSSLHYQDFPTAEKLRIPLGFDLIWRKPVFLNLEQEHMKKNDPGFTPHLIVAGATASGKSNFIKFFITQLLRNHTPDSLRLFLVDPKVVTFRIFRDIPHLYAPIVSDTLKFKVVLEGIIQEVEKRYEILADAGVENLPQLEKVRPDLSAKLPRILVIVDEFADVIDAHSWKIREEINLMLKRLGQKARAAGVHLVLITQRATSSNIDGEIKANLTGRIAFRVATEGDSQVLLEQGKAAHIERPGEGYAQLGDASELVHFQCPYISDKDILSELTAFKNTPQIFVDTKLSEELTKKPLQAKDIVFKMLPVEPFPSIPIGINLESHQPLSLFFGSVNRYSDVEPTPHIVVAGATNSGKSQFAKLLIYKLIQTATPDDMRLLLIDPKAVSFVPFKNVPHLACPLVTEHKFLLPILRTCLEEIEHRYKLFAEHEVENIEVYRIRTGKKLPSLFIIIDEFADLLDFFPYKERDEIEKILKRYGQMARAAGIHIVLITQRATSQNIPGELRANLSGKIALKMYGEADSHYLLEEAGAEKITEPGMFLLKRGSHAPIKGYAPLIHRQDIDILVDLAQKAFGKAKYEPRLEKILSEVAIEDIISTTKKDLFGKGFFE